MCSDYLKGEDENFEEFKCVKLTRYKITFTLIFADLNIYENCIFLMLPVLQKLNEATSLLGPTCDTFISTLEDCMKIANASKAYDSPHQHISDSPFPMVKLKHPPKKVPIPILTVLQN